MKFIEHFFQTLLTGRSHRSMLRPVLYAVCVQLQQLRAVEHLGCLCRIMVPLKSGHKLLHVWHFDELLIFLLAVNGQDITVN